MKQEELKEILDKHAKWLRDEEGGERADLSDADLRRAYLRHANLSDAYLRRADLSGADLGYADLSDANLSDADLSDADLSGANLYGADLSGADLRRAYLSGADLGYADLRRADLGGTCLSPELHELQKQFCRECPPLATGGRIVYRTAKSRNVGSTEYKPGHTYTAPHVSFDCATDCHPGIYAASLTWMQENYPGTKLVVCYVRDGDWIISGKGAIRCKKLRILSYYEED